MAVVLSTLGFGLAGWSGIAVGLVVGSASPWLLIALVPDRRAEQMDAQVPALLDSLARAQRAGLSLGASVAAAGNDVAEPLRSELRVVLARVEAGVGLREALGMLAADQSSNAVTTFVAAMGIALETGGANAQAFDSLAGSMRARLAGERELRAATAGTRYSAMVIVTAPFVVSVSLAVLDPTFASSAVGHPAGRVSLLLGVAFDLAGLWWIRRIFRGAL